MSTAALRADEDRLTASASPGLRGEIHVPGDKSMSHRALILGALAEGETLIEGLLEGEDVLRTAAAVRAFGAEAERLADGRWRVAGAEWHSPAGTVDCGNSGTGARLLMGAAAGFPIAARFTGDRSLGRRPMERVLAPLRLMGAKVEADEGGRLPVTIRGGALGGIVHRGERASAQVKSAILFAGLRAEGEVDVIEAVPTRDHSERMLRAFGCDIAIADAGGERRIRLGPRRSLRGTSLSIPGDPSSAAFPLVAALLAPGSDVTVGAVVSNPLRAGLFATLRRMGADLLIENARLMGGEEIADIRARFGPLRGIDVPATAAASMIDEYPILAVAAAFAEGRTVMRGLAELRFKECDRLAAIVAGLRACGVDAREDGDDLIVEGRGAPPEGGASIRAQDDHRIAMSFLVLGLASARPVTVDSAGMIATSFPGFAALMRGLGARIG